MQAGAHPPQDRERYEAVRRRDCSADGQFYYGVLTTQIYCRPSCGARLPLFQNVTFHPSPEAAERAGFRPCKRCRPRDTAPEPRAREVVRQICALLDGSEARLSLQQLADHVGMSAPHVQRLFKKEVGMSPREYGAAQRLMRMRGALREGSQVTSALYEAGYTSSSRFYERESKSLGMQPSELRRGAPGVLIRSLVRTSSLGPVLIAATPRGVCAISFGDDPAVLHHELLAQYPGAQHLAADSDLEQLAELVLAVIDQGAPPDAVPLDLWGTTFQLRVWRALQQIPRGTTLSYAQLAERIGAPQAARAVGSACGSNRIAVAVPCHRALRGDGSLGGYRWGLSRKQALLERERRTPAHADEPAEAPSAKIGGTAPRRPR